MQSPHLSNGSCDELWLKATHGYMLISCKFLVKLNAGANNRAEPYSWSGATSSTSLKVSQNLCKSSNESFNSSEFFSPVN